VQITSGPYSADFKHYFRIRACLIVQKRSLANKLGGHAIFTWSHLAQVRKNVEKNWFKIQWKLLAHVRFGVYAEFKKIAICSSSDWKKWRPMQTTSYYDESLQKHTFFFTGELHVWGLGWSNLKTVTHKGSILFGKKKFLLYLLKHFFHSK